MKRVRLLILIIVSFGLGLVGNGCDQELHLIEHQVYFLDDQTASLVPERRQYNLKNKTRTFRVGLKPADKRSQTP